MVGFNWGFNWVTRRRVLQLSFQSKFNKALGLFKARPNNELVCMILVGFCYLCLHSDEYHADSAKANSTCMY